jgi:thiazole synthase
MLNNQPLFIAGRQFNSRLLVGTGKFSSGEAMREALRASGTGLATVALKRASLDGRDEFADILDYVEGDRYLLLPNTSGARDAEEAVRIARLSAAAGLPKWVKLEIHPDINYLLPDPIETLKAAEVLVKEGFTVLPYINADPVLAMRLQDVGCATVNAARLAYWQQQGAGERGADTHHYRSGAGACGGRCRHWCAQPRGKGDGDGGRRLPCKTPQ